MLIFIKFECLQIISVCVCVFERKAEREQVIDCSIGENANG